MRRYSRYTLLVLMLSYASLVQGRTLHHLAFSSSRHHLSLGRHKLSSVSQPTFQVQYMVEAVSPPNANVLKWLVEANACPTASQARRACKFGTVVSFSKRRRDEGLETAVWSLQQLENHQIVDPFTIIDPLQQNLAIMTRVPDKFYPVNVTKYIAPPPSAAEVCASLQVVYQDDDIAIVNKPQGLTTIDGGASREDLQSMLPFCLYPPTRNAIIVPRPVHRLDRRTSGLVLCAKTSNALQHYSQAFRERQCIQKTYTAIVVGRPGDGSSGTIDYPIDGKEAVSKWKVLNTRVTNDGQSFSMLEIQPSTGRFHQIRRHLNYCLNCPIVGDPKYGAIATKKALAQRTMFLCANTLEWRGMETGIARRVEIPLPDEFEHFMTQEVLIGKMCQERN